MVVMALNSGAAAAENPTIPVTQVSIPLPGALSNAQVKSFIEEVGSQEEFVTYCIEALASFHENLRRAVAASLMYDGILRDQGIQLDQETNISMDDVESSSLRSHAPVARETGAGEYVPTLRAGGIAADAAASAAARLGISPDANLRVPDVRAAAPLQPGTIASAALIQSHHRSRSAGSSAPDDMRSFQSCVSQGSLPGLGDSGRAVDLINVASVSPTRRTLTGQRSAFSTGFESVGTAGLDSFTSPVPNTGATLGPSPGQKLISQASQKSPGPFETAEGLHSHAEDDRSLSQDNVTTTIPSQANREATGTETASKASGVYSKHSQSAPNGLSSLARGAAARLRATARAADDSEIQIGRTQSAGSDRRPSIVSQASKALSSVKSGVKARLPSAKSGTFGRNKSLPVANVATVRRDGSNFDVTETSNVGRSNAGRSGVAAMGARLLSQMGPNDHRPKTANSYQVRFWILVQTNLGRFRSHCYRDSIFQVNKATLRYPKRGTGGHVAIYDSSSISVGSIRSMSGPGKVLLAKLPHIFPEHLESSVLANSPFLIKTVWGIIQVHLGCEAAEMLLNDARYLCCRLQKFSDFSSSLTFFFQFSGCARQRDDRENKSLRLQTARPAADVRPRRPRC